MHLPINEHLLSSAADQPTMSQTKYKAGWSKKYYTIDACLRTKVKNTKV